METGRGSPICTPVGCGSNCRPRTVFPAPPTTPGPGTADRRRPSRFTPPGVFWYSSGRGVKKFIGVFLSVFSASALTVSRSRQPRKSATSARGIGRGGVTGVSLLPLRGVGERIQGARGITPRAARLVRSRRPLLRYPNTCSAPRPERTCNTAYGACRRHAHPSTSLAMSDPSKRPSRSFFLFQRPTGKSTRLHCSLSPHPNGAQDAAASSSVSQTFLCLETRRRDRVPAGDSTHSLKI